MFNEEMTGLGKGIEQQAKSQERDVSLRTRSKRLLYADKVKSFKEKLEEEFNKVGIDTYKIDLYGSDHDVTKDLIMVSFIATEEILEKVDTVTDFVGKVFIRQNLDKYFDSDPIITDEVDTGDRVKIVYLKWDHSWAKWKKDPIDYIDQSEDEEGGGGGGW